MTTIKLWHDDIRRPPDASWHWARTNDEARDLLLEHNVAECSLDHDLGLDELDPIPENQNLRGSDPFESGYTLVNWMVENAMVPETVTIHSWSPTGAQRMARRLADGGYASTIQPFRN